jgi:hypothetical protein
MVTHIGGTYARSVVVLIVAVAYEPGWGQPPAADPAELIQLMASETPAGETGDCTASELGTDA